MVVSNRNRRRLTIFGMAAFLMVLVIWLISAHFTEPIDSFAACKTAGYPITGSYPEVCRANDRNFTGPLSSPQPSSAPVTNIPFELLVDADSHGDYARGWQVISSENNWVNFWANIHSSVSLPPIIPVDFSSSDVVALSDGPKPTTGYKIVVTSINESSNGTVIKITDTAPLGCTEAQHVTNPYYLVSSPKLTEPITFTLTSSRHQC